MAGRVRVVAAAAGMLAVAACGIGVTDPATDVGSTTATLHGRVGTTEDTGTIAYWFEYGTTDAYGSTTPERQVDVDDQPPKLEQVQEAIGGLEPATTYHYRVCARDQLDIVGCGKDLVFATSGRDRVVGQAGVGSGPTTFLVTLDAASDADGSNPSGTGSYYLPDPGGFRNGTVSCLRVVGDRAAIGFDATSPFADDLVVFVEQKGAGGTSRFEVQWVAQAPAQCPEPPVGDFGFAGVSGGFDVVDAS